MQDFQENAAMDLSLTIHDIDMTEFEAEFAEKMDNARRLIYELDNIIISPSIEQIDSALELLEILDPEVQGEILAAKPELPNRTVDTKVNAFKVRPVKATGAPVTEADLVETAEIVFTDAIIAKALELNHDVVDIFTWVKFNIDYEPYYGSMKGSNETLVDMAGGDVELKIEDLMNWTGGKTPEAAIAIMQRNKIPTEVIYKFDNPEGVIFDHIWVEAFDGHNWRLMDPSFKTYVYTEGVGFDISEEDMSAIIADSATVNDEGNRISMNYDAVYNHLETQAVNYENSVGSLHVDEVLGTRKILVSEKNNLPPYLARGIIGDRKPAEEFSEMPESMQVQVKVIMPGGSEYITSLSEIAGKRVSLVYVPDTDYDQRVINYYGGTIYNVPFPNLLVNMRPVLQIDGETVITGTNIGLGLGGQSVQIGFLRPPYSTWEFTNKPLLAGNRYNISITTQRTSLDELKRLSEEAQIVADASGLSDTDQITKDMIDESLRLSGMLYFGASDVFSDQASEVLDIVSVSHIAVGYICSEIRPVWSGFIFRIILGIDKGSVHIDVVRDVVCPTSTIGSRDDEVAWMKLNGSIGTSMEHAMIEIAYKSEAVSTGKIFGEAAKQDVEIHIIKGETLEADLAAISTYITVKNHIRAYVNAGYTAMIPQRNISLGNWSGQGWMVMDEASGGAGYMICGGLHGETTMVNGGSGTTIIDHPLSYWELFLYILLTGGGPISSGLAHMIAAYKVFAMFPLLGPFCFLGGLIGMALILVGFLAFIKIYSSYPTARLIRRRTKRSRRWYSLCAGIHYLLRLSSKWSKTMSNRPGGGDIVDEYNEKINKALGLPPLDAKNPYRFL